MAGEGPGEGSAAGGATGAGVASVAGATLAGGLSTGALTFAAGAGAGRDAGALVNSQVSPVSVTTAIASPAPTRAEFLADGVSVVAGASPSVAGVTPRY